MVVPGWAVGASVAIGFGLALAAGGAWLGDAIYRSVAPLPPTAPPTPWKSWGTTPRTERERRGPR